MRRKIEKAEELAMAFNAARGEPRAVKDQVKELTKP